MLTNNVFHLQISMRPDERKPLMLYTDATGTGRMGYALFNPHGHLLSWSMLKPPPLVASMLHKRKTQVTAWESIAPLWALLQESQRLRGQYVFVFVDNVGAQYILSKGASKVGDINAVCAAFWIVVARGNLKVNVLRVSSKENPADAPSRGRPPQGVRVGESAISQFLPCDVMQSGQLIRDVVPRELL